MDAHVGAGLLIPYAESESIALERMGIPMAHACDIPAYVAACYMYITLDTAYCRHVVA